MPQILNPKAVLWDYHTLNSVLRQLRRLPNLKINRNRSAGTVIVSTTKGQEVLRSLKVPTGWITRYDSKLIARKEALNNVNQGKDDHHV